MKNYGLVGKQLGHSFSKAFFESKFEREGILANYSNFECSSIDELKMKLTPIQNLIGFNVTIPYKTEIIPFLDELRGDALSVGAVNTVKIEDGKWIGYNTDTFGFQQSIKPFLRNIHERALILGTGGAAKAVAHVLHQLGINVCYLTRNPNGNNHFSYNDANEQMVKAFKLIVNTTPIGMYPKAGDCPSIPLQYVTADHLVIDLIYNPTQTLFLKQAADNGADTLNGLAMLQHQALKAWEIWQSDQMD